MKNQFVKIVDIMRLFKGDGPSCQFEAGKQKGGNYHCWACQIHKDNISNIEMNLSARFHTFTDKCNDAIVTSTCKQRAEASDKFL